MKNLRLRHYKWVAFGILALPILALIVYLAVPLAKPKLELKFVGFTTNRGQVYGLVKMANVGERMAWSTDWFGEPDWEAEIETSVGWITNRLQRFTTVSMPLLPGSNLLCKVPVPEGLQKWKVTAYYSYFTRHHLRLEMAGHIIHSGRRIGSWSEPVAWLLSLLPEPDEEHTSIATGWLTNRPSGTSSLPSTKAQLFP